MDCEIERKFVPFILTTLRSQHLKHKHRTTASVGVAGILTSVRNSGYEIGLVFLLPVSYTFMFAGLLDLVVASSPQHVLSANRKIETTNTCHFAPLLLWLWRATKLNTVGLRTGVTERNFYLLFNFWFIVLSPLEYVLRYLRKVVIRFDSKTEVWMSDVDIVNSSQRTWGWWPS